MNMSTRPTGYPATCFAAPALERALLEERGDTRLLVVEDADGLMGAELLSGLVRHGSAAGAWVAAGRCDAA